jgi:hypothetical protein
MGWLVAACGGGAGGPDAADGWQQDASDEAPPADDGGQVADDGGPIDAGGDPQGEDGADGAGEDGDGGQAADEGGDEGWDGGGDEGGDEGGDQGGADGGDAGGDQVEPLAGCIEGDFLPFFGDLHNHSVQSDGDDDPENAYLWARDEAGLDIFVLTDHMEQLFWPFNEYRDCQDLADSFDDPGTFVALCGFEFATSWFGLSGHNNVTFAPNLFNQLSDINGFYDELAACADCIGAFNHPGDSAGHTWSDFAFHAGAARNLSLIEFNSDADVWPLFFQALDAGWRVSPQYNSDRHGTYAGANYQRTSGFFLRAATREELFDAMIHRRTFMSHDRNSSIALKAQDRCWMGSELRGAASLSLTVVAEDADPGEGFASLELWGPGEQLLTSLDCAGANPCSLEYDLPVAGPTYAVARAIELDGDVLVSAPIWAEP